MADEQSTFTVLVTGANSGLGFAICCRLIDEFLPTHPGNQRLHLLFSTRDARKSADTHRRLTAHLSRTVAKYSDPNNPERYHPLRVHLEGVSVDLLKFSTIQTLAKSLLERDQPLDAVIWNAGIANWRGLNWLKATWLVLTDMVHSTTYPTYMQCDVGTLTALQRPKPQEIRSSSMTASDGDEKVAPTDDNDEPRLGRCFTANVFGHYLLTHWLAPLFHARSRIIWISSISAVPDTFSPDDLQGVHCEPSYESSKRLTDILVLTSDLPSTRDSVAKFLPSTTTTSSRPKMYLTHPGVVGTSIADLHPIMSFFMLLAFHLARLLGSPWHGTTAYKGAVAPVWAALSPDNVFVEEEHRAGGKAKWGSAVNFYGEERAARTEVEGWGWSGVVGGAPPGGAVVEKIGRWKGWRETDRERREEFEEMGRRAWREMEEMREVWEKRLGWIGEEGK